jgi:hypothetical protein
MCTSGPSEQEGVQCVFPFVYNGKAYDECTTDDYPLGVAWCATDIDENGEYIDGKWGHCVPCSEGGAGADVASFEPVNMTALNQEYGEGLVACYEFCVHEPTCNMFSYNEEYHECINVPVNMQSLTRKCLEVITYHSLNEDQLAMHQYTSKKMSSARIYMLDAHPFTLYGLPGKKENCECKDGYGSNSTGSCVPLGHDGAEKFEEADKESSEVHFIQASSDLGDEALPTIADNGAVVITTASGVVIDLQESANFEECLVHFDCDHSWRVDSIRLTCTIFNGCCVVEGRGAKELRKCTAILSPRKQESSGCKYKEVADIAADTFILRKKVEPVGGVSTCRADNPTAKMANLFGVPKHDDLAEECALCAEHSCHEIENLFTNTNYSIAHNALTSHQTENIAFGGGSTVADTIGACLFCEGPSEAADQCSFVRPEVKVRDWAVCDPICAYETCEELNQIVAVHFTEHLSVQVGDLGMYAHRFIYPLCFACDPVKSKCATNPRFDNMTGAAEELLDSLGSHGAQAVLDLFREQVPGAAGVEVAIERKANKEKGREDAHSVSQWLLTAGWAGAAMVLVVCVVKFAAGVRARRGAARLASFTPAPGGVGGLEEVIEEHRGRGRQEEVMAKEEVKIVISGGGLRLMELVGIGADDGGVSDTQPGARGVPRLDLL